jgi:hypothetical protein
MGQLHQLALLLNHAQQGLHQHKLKVPNNAVLPEPSPNLMMPQGVPIEDTVLQLQIEFKVVQFRLRSNTACVGGYNFESYEDTLKSVTANCSAEDCEYVIDMPAVYSLVRPDGKYMMYSCRINLILVELVMRLLHTRGWLFPLRPRFQESLGLIGLPKMGILLRPVILMTSGFPSVSDRVSEIKWDNRPRRWNLHFQSK